MVVSPFVEFPDPVRVTAGVALRVGPPPKCRSSAFTEGPEKSFGVLAEQDLEGNRNPMGGVAEAEVELPPGAGSAPKQ